MAVVEKPSAAVAAELGLVLLQSRDQWKNAPRLVEMLSATDDGAIILEASKSLHAFFLPLLKSGEVTKSDKANGAASVNADDLGEDTSMALNEEDDELGAFSLKATYRNYTRGLLAVVGKEKTPLNVKRWAVELVMELVRLERPNQFNNNLFLELCTTLVESRWLSGDLVNFLRETYFEYVDVSYSLFSNIRRRITLRQSKWDSSGGAELASSDEESDKSRPISIHAFARNAYDLLRNVPVGVPGNASKGGAKTGGGDGPELAWCREAEEGRWRTAKWRKKAASECWLTFLRLPLPVDIYKKVLVSLHTTVIPSVSSPLLLSDFLTDSYNVGGVVSVMALNGLFVLMTEHGLEYPNFYKKLYALLEPSVFTAKHRARFFELLDICLNSSHLPAYLAAAFAKRVARMALSAPPSGALIVIAAVHNLLRRHPSINTLVHRTETVESGAGDPFLADESDPAKCNALGSSLWEMETLRQHYCPAVARFVASLETDLTVRAKTAEVPINDFTSGSYATILSEETGRRVKSASLAYYRRLPSTLFARPETALAKDSTIADAHHFSGWSFCPAKKGEKAAEDGALPKSLEGVETESTARDLPAAVQKQGSEEVRENGSEQGQDLKSSEDATQNTERGEEDTKSPQAEHDSGEPQTKKRKKATPT